MSKVWRRWSQTDSEAILKRKRSRKLRLCEAMVCGSKASTSDNHLLEETTRCGGNPFWKGRDVVRLSYSLVNTTDSGVAKGVHDGKPISRHSLGFAQIKNYINILLPLEKSFYLIISTSVVPFRNQVKPGSRPCSLVSLRFKVFRYSFPQTILTLFNRLKSNFILVWSLQNFHQWLTMNWSLSKCSF